MDDVLQCAAAVSVGGHRSRLCFVEGSSAIVELLCAILLKAAAARGQKLCVPCMRMLIDQSSSYEWQTQYSLQVLGRNK